MNDKYNALIEALTKELGGESNIKDLNHCQTRLRLVLNNYDRVNIDNVKNIDGIISVVVSGGQCQVVIGTHVKEVYDVFKQKLNLDLSSDGADVAQGEKASIISRAIDFVSGTFSPIIPAIAGAGMVKALLAVLLMFDLVSRDSQTYYLINMMSDAVFYFLPILLAFSAAQKLKCSPLLAAVLGGVLLHPSFVALKAAGDPVEIFSMPIRMVSYGSSVIPILLIVWLQSIVERNLNKVIPDSIKIVFVPMCTIFIVGIAGLTVLGPLGSYIGDYIVVGFEAIQAHGSWLIILLMATLWPILVMFGIHHSIVPLSLAQITTMGVENIIGPGALIANIAHGVAALVVSRRVIDSKTKQIANSGGITALMGITEPALYGVNIPKKYPLVTGMIGAACGGLYAGLGDVYRYATGASGIPAIPLYIGENTWNLYNILISLGITIVVTAVLTYLATLRYEKKADQKSTDSETAKQRVNEEMVYAPMNGKVIPLSAVTDEVFASEALGPGLAIEPTEGKVVAPFDCTVVSIFPTNHAVCLESDNGMELLIHVGIDTVSLGGKHFEGHVVEGQKVKAGQTLITCDLEAIRSHKLSTQTPIIVTNLDDDKRLDTCVEEQSITQINDKFMLVNQH
ncbi:beta-glucoside-specific PTS transporter subunit IIABC [Photobacterium rosenbergii]|uniref:Beta-glucoside-specific PTS transporter subunit IIABC n=1 Tax=Photobacterium rosenbergii TaxID=294936 RepID=A0ABU3ZNT1_9GAMM|nr:beta-glucoside-specific PTS transporter subunit IIABC [Photobacterium rosenbergii]MDV5171583.1 beta-glucoside-specific PTS transporter subunit IIABC [Photobacterium rosenbergii]